MNDPSPTRQRFAALAALRTHREFTKLLAMMGLSFLVIFVVGVLRPIRDAIALDGLEPGDFYQVYFVSAIVVLVVPIYNRLADRLSWKTLIPGVALFFAMSMVVFRFLYRPGNATFGMAFYGWYDLMVASLVTQFFMATQVFYNARDAKRAYPLVIAAGSVGAAVGGGITAFFAQRVGTPNLLLVASASITLFAFGIAAVWARENPDADRPRDREFETELSIGEFRRIFSNRQVQLIALTVLLTILVKQFIDYEYKTLTREVYQDLDRMSGFLGLVDAATQWLPIVVLLALRPVLRRWGAGVTVLIFPVAMLFATGALALAMTLPIAVAARTGERMFRYSAERTGREILYVPVPEDIKLKAKGYIDVAVEKGLGKVLSGVMLLILSLVLSGTGVRQRLVVAAVISVILAVGLLMAFLRVRKEYVTTLARSIQGRFASLRGTFVSLTGPRTRALVSQALRDPDRLKRAFSLEMLEQADPGDVAHFAPDVLDLLDDESEVIRRRALEVLERIPEFADPGRVHRRLEDDDPRVREAAVRLLTKRSDRPGEEVLRELLAHGDPRIRSATLACLAHDTDPVVAESIARPFYETRLETRDSATPEERLELALAAGLVPNAPGVAGLIAELIQDPDDAVAEAALMSAAQVGTVDLTGPLLRALGEPRTRAAARAALARRGDAILEPLIGVLNDPEADPRVRRNIPGALADRPSGHTVKALIDSYMRPETEQVLDNRTLGALTRIRASHPELVFPAEKVLEVVDREIEAALRYHTALLAAETLEPTPTSELLARALREARRDRRASLFKWLGLVHSPSDMYRSYLAIEHGSVRQAANALEWLETTIGYQLYQKLRPALDTEPEGGATRPVTEALRELWDDEDAWIARLAMHALAETDPRAALEQLDGYETSHPGLRATADRLRRRLRPDVHAPTTEDDKDMDLVEKVFLLQNVDLLSAATSQQLALLGAIARVVEVDEGRVLLKRGEPTDALYVVIRGRVELEGVGGQTITVTDGSPFGTWALIDRDPSLVEARALEPTRLLRISRADFHDLLVDHPEMGLDLLQGLARRIRTLVAA